MVEGRHCAVVFPNAPYGHCHTGTSPWSHYKGQEKIMEKSAGNSKIVDT